MKVCAEPGCPTLVERGTARCDAHRLPDRRPADRWRYNDRKWRRIRAQFLKLHPICTCPGCPASRRRPGHTGVCGGEATIADHIIRRRDGGSDRHENLQPRCQSCHSAKTVREDSGFGRPAA